MQTKLKFKIIRCEYDMPNGYRLATVEEVWHNLDTLRRRQLLEDASVHGFRCPHHRRARLLDGDIFPGYRIQQHVFVNLSWYLVVKEKERDGDAGVWKKKCSACYPSNGNLLRKQVYDGITLTREGRDTAMALASIHGDAEVLYWLLQTTNQIEAQQFRDLLNSLKMQKDRGSRGEQFSKLILDTLSASQFPLQLPLERHHHFLNYLKENNRWYYTLRASGILLAAAAIVYLELLVEMYSTDIVHEKVRDGMSFLDTVTGAAMTDEDFIPALTKLLSVSDQHSLENQVSKIRNKFGDILIEATERGYAQLVQDLLKLKDYVEQLPTNVCLEIATGAVRKGYLHDQCLSAFLNVLKQKAGNELQHDKHRKTLFHYAAESENGRVFQLLVETYGDVYRDNKRDKWGRSLLHWAALNGQAHFCNGKADFCKDWVDKWQLKVDAKDSFGRNSLHFAAQGKKGHLVVDYFVASSSVNLIYARDDEGRTPLHFASAKGNIKMVEKLLSTVELADDPSQVRNYIEQADGFGKTALQMAARGGHTPLVRLLLDKGSDPLSERDVYGGTALHCATQVEDAEVAGAISQNLLNKYGKDKERKSLLLWASAAGIGTAEESKGVKPFVKDFLLQEKSRYETNLLEAAAETKNTEMAWELLNRGARFTDLDQYRNRDKDRGERMKKAKSGERMENAKSVLNEIEIAKEHGQDKPTLEDNLERTVLAEGLAALFLNKFIESPITVGISGEWGMGKSSLMIQTENILLMAASQLSFPNNLRSEKFVGANKISLTAKGRKIYTRMQDAISKLSGFNTERGLVQLLKEYHPQYHAIYKSLACMDIHNQMLSSSVHSESQLQQMKGVPRILTIRYNAWHYRDEHEAWAGLAVTITKEIERAMTRAQRFSTCWRYSWAKHSSDICIQIFLPCLLVTFLAGWVAWAAWTLLKDAKFKDLKYGSIPCTLIAIVWAVLKSVISVVKPVSTQMMGYINSPDHTTHLGYQEQVISDINFLKSELGIKPHSFFSFISGEWCRNWFGLYPDNVENTCIPKFRPASEDQLRIITFVDDLDRCDEKVVLQILSAINLVLAECKINVILGIDKKLIQRAVERHFKDNDDRDLADKFICKIIQIPLSLPDPTDKESDKFLQHYLGYQPPLEATFGMEDNEDTDYGDIDTDNDDEGVTCPSTRQENVAINIDCSNGLYRGCQGIIKKLLHLLACFFQLLYLLSCKLSSELRQIDDESDTKEIYLLTFSKGARLTREMLLSNYSKEEASTLYKFKRFTTGSQKLPREWKRFMDYRKFVCNILSMEGKVYRLLEWKLELVAWTFICWNWKHEMNILIKGWHKYAVFQATSKDEDVEKHVYGPPLREIVINYVMELRETQQVLDIHADLGLEGELNSTTTEARTIEESQTQYSNWLNLLKALNIQDVSMKGIQLFQQYRFHCETDNLPWPLLESNYSQEEVDTLHNIKKFATGRRKSYHEWKLFWDYNKFAHNTLSMIGKVHNLPSWKAELVTWIFVCWQWEHEMNTLIKGWRKYAAIRYKDKGKSVEVDEVKEHQYGPSLKQIVVNYIEYNFNKYKRKMDVNDGTIVEENQSCYTIWLNLLEVLSIQDIPMRCIQLFQQFRLNCEIDHLPWPLLESYVDRYKRLSS